MKNKYIKLTALIIGIVIGTASISYAISGNDSYFIQRDPTNSFMNITFMPFPTLPSFPVLDPSIGVSGTAMLTSFGSGLSFDNSAKTLSVLGVPQSSITNLTSDLALKSNISSLSTVATTGNYSDLTGKPTLFSGSYTDLTSKPSLATVATSGSYTDLSNKPTIPTQIAYEGTTQRTNAFPIFKSVTVASGVAVFNLTSDGSAGGSALCTNGVIQDSVNTFVSDATASYQMSYAFSNSNKTVTITTNKLTTANILTGILGQASGNGSVVKLSVWCY